MTFQKAERKKKKARIVLTGPSGSGKTYTALAVATGLCAPGERIAFIDTERSSALMYAPSDRSKTPGECEFDFDHVDLADFKPKSFLDRLEEAERGGYSVGIIDSLTHVWDGPGGFLEMQEAATKRNPKHDSFQAWGEVTPIYKRFVDRLLASPLHLIVCLRTKTDYGSEKNENTGKTKRVKLGLAPKFRPESEYEWDLVIHMDMENTGVVEKTRIGFLNKAVIPSPGTDLGVQIVNWLDSGAPEAVIEPAELPDEYVIETTCTQKGKSLSLIREESPQWLAAVMADARRMGALSKRDQVNIKAYMANMKEAA